MKNTISIAIVSSLSATAVLTSYPTQALNVRGWDVGIQPRVEGGLMYYEYKQDAVSKTVLSTSTQLGSNYTQKSFKYKDTMPFISGGATFFVERFFIDLSAQKVFNGSDSDKIPLSGFVEIGTAGFVSANPDYDADFDRKDYAISVGYGITDQVSIFAGYKWAKTDFDTKGSGPFSALFIPDGFGGRFSDRDNLDGTFTQELNYDFEYDGPFVGLAYGLDVNKNFLKGNVSFNFAAAFLDGKVNVDGNPSSITINKLDGDPIEPFQFETDSLNSTFDSKGDTIGLTFGINWRGFTPVENLTYTLGVNGYKYSFDADDDDPDINETAINFRIGVAYVF